MIHLNMIHINNVYIDVTIYAFLIRNTSFDALYIHISIHYKCISVHMPIKSLQLSFVFII